GEKAGELHPVVGGPRLFAEGRHLDVLAVRDQLLEEALADHPVADDDDPGHAACTSRSRKSARPRANETPFQNSTGLRSASDGRRSRAAFGWRRSYTNSESDG